MGIDPSAPRWLRALPPDRSCADWLALGVSVLVDASIRAAVGPPPITDDRPSARKCLAGVRRRLAELPRRAGLGQLDLTSESDYVRLALSQAVSSSSAGVAACQGDLMESLRCFVDSARPVAAGARERTAAGWEGPQSLLRLAHSRLTDGASTSGLVESDCAALMAIGAANHGLSVQIGCQVCFRWAVAGYRHCGRHVISQADRDETAEREAEARHARAKAGRQAKSRGLIRLTAEERLFVIARHLWGTAIPDAARTARAIRARLDRAPNVMSVIAAPMPSDPEQLFELLRLRLDPYEVRPGAWIAKIDAAARWVEEEAAETRSHRGVGTKTEEMLAHAAHLAGCHRVSRADMPLAMGVSKASFEALLGRNPERAAVKSLLKAWVDSKGAREREQHMEEQLERLSPLLVRTKFGAPLVTLVQYDPAADDDSDDEEVVDAGLKLEVRRERAPYHRPLPWRVWPSCGCPVSSRDRRRRSMYARLRKEFFREPDDVHCLQALLIKARRAGMVDCAYQVRLRVRKLELFRQRMLVSEPI